MATVITDSYWHIAGLLGWACRKSPMDGSMELEQSSPAGEDIVFALEGRDIPKEMREYAANFDVDEHVGLHAANRGKNGCPKTFRELVHNAEEVQSMLNKLAAAFNAIERGEEPDLFGETPVPADVNIRFCAEDVMAAARSHPIDADLANVWLKLYGKAFKTHMTELGNKALAQMLGELKVYYTQQELIQAGLKQAKAAPQWDAALRDCPLDYVMPVNSDALVKDCRIEVIFNVTYGGSEGIYGDVSIQGMGGRYSMCTIKTLETSKEAYLGMCALCGLVAYHTTEVINHNLNRFDG